MRAWAMAAVLLALGGCSQMNGCGDEPREPTSHAIELPASQPKSFASAPAQVSRFDSAPAKPPTQTPAARPPATDAHGLLTALPPSYVADSAALAPAARAVPRADEPPARVAEPAHGPPARAESRIALDVLGALVGLLLLFAAAWLLRRGAGSARPVTIRGQYEIVRQIGEGGMGLVYEGRDLTLHRKVAIKRLREDLRRDPRERRRFLEEARLVAALHHPNIVDIFAIAEEGDDVYLIFEHIDGRTLHELIGAEGRLALVEATALLRGVADALDFAHSRGVIHRDLKPSNVMIDALGRARVMDFGIARAAQDALTRRAVTNTILGTPPYMAPEQEQGAVRPESDVYALGVCLYETLTGALPFSGSTGAGMLMNKMKNAFPPASTIVKGLPAGLDEVLAKALQAEPEKRFATAGQLIAALSALAG